MVVAASIKMALLAEAGASITTAPLAEAGASITTAPLVEAGASITTAPLVEAEGEAASITTALLAATAVPQLLLSPRLSLRVLPPAAARLVTPRWPQLRRVAWVEAAAAAHQKQSQTVVFVEAVVAAAKRHRQKHGSTLVSVAAAEGGR